MGVDHAGAEDLLETNVLGQGFRRAVEPEKHDRAQVHQGEKKTAAGPVQKTVSGEANGAVHFLLVAEVILVPDRVEFFAVAPAVGQADRRGEADVRRPRAHVVHPRQLPAPRHAGVGLEANVRQRAPLDGVTTGG